MNIWVRLNATKRNINRKHEQVKSSVDIFWKIESIRPQSKSAPHSAKHAHDIKVDLTAVELRIKLKGHMRFVN